MDGRFVPNITFGPLVVKAIKPHTKLPLCCHLMIVQPENYIEAFAEAGAAEITVHAEACPHLHRTLQQIKATGVRAGVALNPSTPLCMVENVYADMDFLLVMTVNPGFGGQCVHTRDAAQDRESRGRWPRNSIRIWTSPWMAELMWTRRPKSSAPGPIYLLLGRLCSGTRRV